MAKVKIALLGYGTVGRGVAKVLDMNSREIALRAGGEIEVAKILVRDRAKHRELLEKDSRFTTEFDEILNDDKIGIVVELMGGEEPATTYMCKAMDRGKHVVTANKMAIALNGDRLFSKVKERDCYFFYEASVGGGIPILRQINESLNANKIESIAGIINGTSNYILTKMSKEGMSFEQALKIAQDLGYAEADPTSDVGGHDAVYKLAVMSSLAFGTKVEYSEIYREGIEAITDRDILYAKRFGFAIKLLAVAKRNGRALELRVHPTMVPAEHPMANINNAYNAIFITGNAVDDIMISGKGAGSLPTASAVVSDVIAVVRGAPKSSGIDTGKEQLPVLPMEQNSLQYYIRINVKDVVGVLADIAGIFAKHKVSIRTMVQEKTETSAAEILFTTHYTKEGNLQQAMGDIAVLPTVNKIANIIRIEDLY